MSNLTKLQFHALDISGNNYLSWVLDADIHLNAMNLGDSIKDENEASLQDRAKAMIFLRHHLHDQLKSEYLTVKDPLILWKDLKERFEHQKTVILPRTKYEWLNLRLQDYKTVSEYNSALFKICSKLKLCGETVTDEDMLEKTYSTFHASNVLLQQQYRERGFKKYSELISCLLVAEQNNELLLKNHQSRPTGSTPFPEANVNTISYQGRGRGRGGRGRGRKNFQIGVKHPPRPNNKGANKWVRGEENPEKKKVNNDNNICNRCGTKGHWFRQCRIPKHLADLYQASLKAKDKKAEVNFSEPVDASNVDNPNDDESINIDFDVSDFFADESGRIDHLIGDGNVQ